MIEPGRKLLVAAAVLLVLGLCALAPCRQARGEELIWDLDEFMSSYREAVRRGEPGRVERVVARGEPAVYPFFLGLADRAASSFAGGGDGAGFLEQAEQLAGYWEAVTGKSGLAEMAALYRGYSPDLFARRARAVELYEQGAALNREGRAGEAIGKWSEALQSMEELQDPSYVAQIMDGAGLMVAAVGEYEGALNAYLVALGVADFTGDPVMLLNVNGHLAEVYENMGSHEEAIGYREEQLALYRRLRLPDGEVYTLQNIGYNHLWLGRLERGTAFMEQALERALTTGDTEVEADSRAGLATAYKFADRGTEALAQYEEALPLYRELGNRVQEAEVLQNMGDLQVADGRPQEAMDSYLACLEIARALGDQVVELEVSGQAALVLNELGRYREALEQAGRALELCELLGDQEAGAGVLTTMSTSLSSLGRMREAMERQVEALAVQRKAGDVSGQVNSLVILGTFHDFFGRNSEALQVYREAYDLAETMGDRAGMATARTGMAGSYLKLGRYTDALTSYREAMELAERVAQPFQRRIVLPPVVLGLGLVQERIGRFEQALALFEKFEGEIQKLGIASTEIDVRLHQGRVLTRMGRYDEALERLTRALERAKELDMVGARSSVLRDLGAVYRKSEDRERAAASYREALDIDRKAGNRPGQAALLAGLGDLALEGGLPEEAAGLFREAADLAGELGLLETLWRSRRGLGRALWESGSPREAVEHYRAAVRAIVELYRNTSGFAEEERTAMIADKGRVFVEFIELLLLLHREEPEAGHDREAFRVAEQDKSRIFQEMMARAGAGISFGGDRDFREMVQRSHQFAGQRAGLRGLLEHQLSLPPGGRNDEVVASLERELAGVEREMAALEVLIEERYPRYADLRRPQPAEIPEIQGHLKPGEALVSYHLGRSSSVAFLLTPDSFDLVELPAGGEELSSLVRRLRAGLEGIGSYRDLERFDPQDAHRLYRAVFQPLAGGLDGAEVLYISADGVLHTFPLEALACEEPDQEAFRKARRDGRRGRAGYLAEYAGVSWLADRYTLCYLPSASLLRSLREHPKPGFDRWERPLVAFADPVFDPGEEPASCSGDVRDAVGEEAALTAELLRRSTGGAVLARLPESAEEARAIRGVLRGRGEDLYLRRRASEENVYAAPLGSARYLLFSTHGLLGGDFSGVAEPSLALTLAGAGEGMDGFLSMNEVLGLDLNADLVVLSACNTSGRGEQAGKGEGFAGLTRSFMYAGARSLLVTHWSVESRAARDLMVLTFRALQGTPQGDAHSVKTGDAPAVKMGDAPAGKSGGPASKARALRRARLEMKDSTRTLEGGRELSLAHPFFWAPFVLVGEP
ncbi:MAG: tetratricopeptide repeat protein [Spirochaetota bacterium]